MFSIPAVNLMDFVDDFIYSVGANPLRMTLLIKIPYKTGNFNTANGSHLGEINRFDRISQPDLAVYSGNGEFSFVEFLRTNILRSQ